MEAVTRLSTLLSSALSPLLSSASAAQLPATANDLVNTAGQYRGLADSYVLHGRIKSLRDGVRDKVQPYQLLAGTNRLSLVIFTDWVNKGQKVLIPVQQFWLPLPGSRRPLRITPMQKLLGKASTGNAAALGERRRRYPVDLSVL